MKDDQKAAARDKQIEKACKWTLRLLLSFCLRLMVDASAVVKHEIAVTDFERETGHCKSDFP